MSTFYFAGYFTQSLLPRRNRSRLLCLSGATVLATLILSTPTLAQVPDARAVATFGPVLEPGDVAKLVWETHIAAGPRTAVALFNQTEAPKLQHRIGFAVAEISVSGWNWVEDGAIPLGTANRVIDPAIAFEPQTGQFLAVALGDGIMVSRYLGQPGQRFEPWRRMNPEVQGGMDKPWIVAGAEQEYYVVYQHVPSGPFGQPPGYAYGRSVDGGATFMGGPIAVNGQRITQAGLKFTIHPAVVGDGPLYVAYTHEALEPGMTMRFVKGTDAVDPGSGATTVVWHHLLSCAAPACEDPLEVSILRHDVLDRLPGQYYGIETDPQLAADPTNPDRLFLVHHDSVAPDGQQGASDINVYLRVLTRNGCCWEVGPRIQVNPDVTLFESDQFLPSIWVDWQGRVHIVYYDDRRYTDPLPGQPNEDQQQDGMLKPRFDVWYSYSEDAGATFEHELLFGVPDLPALDYRHALFPGLEPGEYIGITSFQNEVWTSFTGSLETADPNDEESLIWSSRIPWQP